MANHKAELLTVLTNKWVWIIVALDVVAVKWGFFM